MNTPQNFFELKWVKTLFKAFVIGMPVIQYLYPSARFKWLLDPAFAPNNLTPLWAFSAMACSKMFFDWINPEYETAGQTEILKSNQIAISPKKVLLNIFLAIAIVALFFQAITLYPEYSNLIQGTFVGAYILYFVKEHLKLRKLKRD